MTMFPSSFFMLENQKFISPLNTDSNLSWSSHRHMPYHDGKDSVRVSAPSMLQASKSTKEHTPHSLHMQVHDANGRHFLSHKPLDSEHKLRSSSPQARTSLHSQVRSRVGSGKGRFQVSFSEDSISDISRDEKGTGWKLDLLDFDQGISPSRSLNSNDAGKLTRDLRLGSCAAQRLTSSTPHRELLTRLADDRKAADSVHHYSSKVAKEDLVSTWSSCRDFRGQYSDPERSLKHSSDAKLNNQFLTTSASLDFQSKCRSLLDEKALEDSQPVSESLSVAQRGQEPPVNRSLGLSRVDFKHSRSPTRCFKEANEHQCNEQKRGHIWTECPLGAEKSCPVIVLRRFLELVDRYWDGSGSLLLNKDFLGPALDLLRNLMTAAPSQQDYSSTAVAAQSSNSTGINYKIPKDLSKDYQYFPGVDKPMQKPEERQVASFKELSREASTALNYSLQGKQPFSYDELLSRNEQLSAQVHVLTSELKQLKNQQDTINLLWESQKSLVSTNSYLLQQLNKEQGPSSAKGDLLLEKTTSSTMAPFLERTPCHSLSSSAFGFSQLHSSEQLSSCPL